MAVATDGISFLYQYAIGEYNYTTPGANIISVTSTATGDHDKLYLTTPALRETWRSTDLTNQEIIIQANDTSVVPNVFAILGHNFTSDAVVILQCSMINNFVSPALTVPISWNEKNMVLNTSLGQAYNYYKLKITDPGNPCGFLEIGRIVGGKAFIMTNNEDIADDFTIGTDDLASTMQTEGYFRASNERVKVDNLTLSFPKLLTKALNAGETFDNYTNLIKMVRFVGITLPFLTIPDPSDPYFQITWGQLKSLPSRSYTVNRFVTLQLSIGEVF